MATKLVKHVLSGDNDSAFQAAFRLWRKRPILLQRKLRAFSLAHIENIRGAEPNQNGPVLSADVLLGLFILFSTYSDYGGQNADAVLALLDLAAKLVPRIDRR